MSKYVNLWNEYKNWLIYKVNFTKKGYDLLLNELHNSPFEAILDRDTNRIEDGEALRSSFFYEQRLNGDFMDQEIGVLEVLVALAIRIDDEYLGNPVTPHPEIIFWEMICNLGLNKCDNSHFNRDYIYEKLAIWINREFDFYGNGSIFPLRACNFDQKSVEIWSQMKAYLNEKA